MRKFTWDKKDRIRLQKAAQKGYSIEQISKIIAKSRYTITQELKRGLSENEWEEKLYVGYSPKKAIISLMKDLLGDNVDFVEEVFEEKEDEQE